MWEMRSFSGWYSVGSRVGAPWGPGGRSDGGGRRRAGRLCGGECSAVRWVRPGNCNWENRPKSRCLFPSAGVGGCREPVAMSPSPFSGGRWLRPPGAQLSLASAGRQLLAWPGGQQEVTASGEDGSPCPTNSVAGVSSSCREGRSVGGGVSPRQPHGERRSPARRSEPRHGPRAFLAPHRPLFGTRLQSSGLGLRPRVEPVQI